MTDRDELMSPFEMLPGLQVHHLPSGATVDLVPWSDPSGVAVAAAREDLYAALREALPAGWLSPMERAVAGIAAILRAAGPPAGMRILQIKEKFGTLRVYVHITGKAEDMADLDRIVAWAEASSEGRCMVTGGAGTIEREGWLVTLAPEMRRLRASDPARLTHLMYPDGPSGGSDDVFG